MKGRKEGKQLSNSITIHRPPHAKKASLSGKLRKREGNGRDKGVWKAKKCILLEEDKSGADVALRQKTVVRDRRDRKAD